MLLASGVERPGVLTIIPQHTEQPMTKNLDLSTIVAGVTSLIYLYTEPGEEGL